MLLNNRSKFVLVLEQDFWSFLISKGFPIGKSRLQFVCSSKFNKHVAILKLTFFGCPSVEICHVLFADDVTEFARHVNVFEEIIAAAVKQATKDGAIISWGSPR